VTTLRPFWRYYGGKWRSAPRYPAPVHGTIIEPFAGSAGYSLRYLELRVTLVERYHVIAEIWRFLIGVSESELLRIPCVESVDDLPTWVPDGGRWLVGFNMNTAGSQPRRTLSSGCRKLLSAGRKRQGWNEAQRAMVASQLGAIRHWKIIEGDYSDAPDVKATWFVDAPYQGRAGSHYVHGSAKIGWSALGLWCACRRGQVIVCEASGADWLPFMDFGTVKSGPNSKTGTSAEAIWLGGLS
jgi:hypothetical protein